MKNLITSIGVSTYDKMKNNGRFPSAPVFYVLQNRKQIKCVSH